MDDAALVRRFQRVGDLSRDRRARRPPAIGPRAMRADRSSPSTSSMTRRVGLPSIFEAVDLRDIGMIERRQGLRFAPEARDAVGIVGDMCLAGP